MTALKRCELGSCYALTLASKRYCPLHEAGCKHGHPTDSCTACHEERRAELATLELQALGSQLLSVQADCVALATKCRELRAAGDDFATMIVGHMGLGRFDDEATVDRDSVECFRARLREIWP